MVYQIPALFTIICTILDLRRLKCLCFYHGKLCDPLEIKVHGDLYLLCELPASLFISFLVVLRAIVELFLTPLYGGLNLHKILILIKPTPGTTLKFKLHCFDTHRFVFKALHKTKTHYVKVKVRLNYQG